MRRSEVTEEMIRKEWFPNHEGLYQKIGGAVEEGNHERLIWAAPETNCFSVHYIRYKNYLMVTGDIGCATYWWSQSNNLRWIAGCNLGYFAGKCEASELGRQYEETSMDLLRARLEDLFKTEEYAACKAAFDEYNGWDKLEDEITWQCFCRTHGYDIFGEDWFMCLPDGKRISPRCHGHLVGLKMAFEQMSDAFDNKGNVKGR